MIKELIEVEIENIIVDTRYYSFDFKVTRNGKAIKESSYESDHVWTDFDTFRKLLEDSFAVELALEQALPF